MDINVLRIGVTLLSVAGFLWIVYWAYKPARKAELDAQGRAILGEDE